MDIKQDINYRYNTYENVKKYYVNCLNKYNYEEEGILKKCLPKILFKGNSILVTFLQLIDIKIIMLFKYIDKLKKFKYISSY
jgi:hypothetical protein